MQVENALVAQTVLFADDRETHGWKVLRSKMDAVPASLLISGQASRPEGNPVVFYSQK